MIRRSSKRTQRLYTLLLCFLGLLGIALFFGVAFRQNIRFFVTPSQVFSENLLHHKNIRLGGVVKEGSVQKKNLLTTFLLTDGAMDMSIQFEGVLPDLFREGQTIVAQGSFDSDNNHMFKATSILAKHDENYTPPLLKNIPASVQRMPE